MPKEEQVVNQEEKSLGKDKKNTVSIDDQIKEWLKGVLDIEKEQVETLLSLFSESWRNKVLDDIIMLGEKWEELVKLYNKREVVKIIMDFWIEEDINNWINLIKLLKKCKNWLEVREFFSVFGYVDILEIFIGPWFFKNSLKIKLKEVVEIVEFYDFNWKEIILFMYSIILAKVLVKWNLGKWPQIWYSIAKIIKNSRFSNSFKEFFKWDFFLGIIAFLVNKAHLKLEDVIVDILKLIKYIEDWCMKSLLDSKDQLLKDINLRTKRKIIGAFFSNFWKFWVLLENWIIEWDVFLKELIFLISKIKVKEGNSKYISFVFESLPFIISEFAFTREQWKDFMDYLGKNINKRDNIRLLFEVSKRLSSYRFNFKERKNIQEIFFFLLKYKPKKVISFFEETGKSTWFKFKNFWQI